MTEVESYTNFTGEVKMVITMLEAQVAPENAAKLESEFKQAVQEMEAGIVQTFLVRASKDPGIWRIMTVWESRQALDAMRATAQTPRGVLIFKAAGAEPVLSVFEVVGQAKAQSIPAS
jgi:quinol monooxygenase YgiN